MTRPDYCPVAQEPCQAMCDVPCKIKDIRQQPKREWVGLTDEDMRLCLAVADYNQGRYKRTQYWAHLATAIEAKLRELNGM